MCTEELHYTENIFQQNSVKPRGFALSKMYIVHSVLWKKLQEERCSSSSKSPNIQSLSLWRWPGLWPQLYAMRDACGDGSCLISSAQQHHKCGSGISLLLVWCMRSSFWILMVQRKMVHLSNSSISSGAHCILIFRTVANQNLTWVDYLLTIVATLQLYISVVFVSSFSMLYLTCLWGWWWTRSLQTQKEPWLPQGRGRLVEFTWNKKTMRMIS